MVHVIHPAVDEWGEGYAVFATGAPTVRFTDAFETFLIGAAEECRRPVLLSTTDSAVSGFVSLAMRRAGGYWMVQARDGSTFNAMTGRQVTGAQELWGGVPAGRPLVRSFDGPPQRVAGALSFDVHCLRLAEGSTLAGEVAQVVVGALGSAGLDAWGVHEPLLEPWGPREVTTYLQGRMPDAGPILARGPDGAFATVRVSRTKLGLLENAAGVVPLQEPTNDLDTLVGLASGMLEQVAASFNTTIGFCSVVDYDAGSARGDELTQGARARLPEAPLAVLLGPRTVRDVGIDVAELSAAHDVVRVGRAKTPGLIVRFSRPDVGLWAQLVEVVSGVGVERVAALAGLPVDASGGSRAD